MFNKAKKSVWMKNGCPISVEDDDRISIVDEGINHCLQISDAALEDSGDYSTEVDDLDYGKTGIVMLHPHQRCNLLPCF